MAALNKTMHIGGLTRDPEVKMTPSGQKVATFTLACSEKWTDRNGVKQEKVEYVNFVAWRKLAEIIERYVKKGSSIYIEGKLTTRSWDDPQSGQKRYKTEIVASQMQMLGGRSDGFNQDSGRGDYNQDTHQGGGYNQDLQGQNVSGEIEEGDLPF